MCISPCIPSPQLVPIWRATGSTGCTLLQNSFARVQNQYSFNPFSQHKTIQKYYMQFKHKLCRCKGRHFSFYIKKCSFPERKLCPLFAGSKAFPFTPTIADKWQPESSKGCKKVQKGMLRVRRTDIFPEEKNFKKIHRMQSTAPISTHSLYLDTEGTYLRWNPNLRKQFYIQIKLIWDAILNVH